MDRKVVGAVFFGVASKMTLPEVFRTPLGRGVPR